MEFNADAISRPAEDFFAERSFAVLELKLPRRQALRRASRGGSAGSRPRPSRDGLPEPSPRVGRGEARAYLTKSPLACRSRGGAARLTGAPGQPRGWRAGELPAVPSRNMAGRAAVPAYLQAHLHGRAGRGAAPPLTAGAGRVPGGGRRGAAGRAPGLAAGATPLCVWSRESRWCRWGGRPAGRERGGGGSD